MPVRLLSIWGVLLGLLGLVILAALVVIGLDLRRARTEGPRWRRRLVAPGLALLAAAGAYVPARQVLRGPVMVTCYAALPPPTGVAVRDIAARVALVEAQARDGNLPAHTLESIAQQLRYHVQFLEGAERRLAAGKDPNDAADHALAAEMRSKAVAALTAVQQRLDAVAPLAADPRWETIADVWRFAHPLADSQRSTTAQRQQAAAQLAVARAALERLLHAGRLDQAEHDLLAGLTHSMERAMCLNPPTDTRIMCYTMPVFVPASMSLEALAARLPLLKRLASSSYVTPAVMEKVLPAVEADLAVLTDAGELARLDEAQRAKAEQTAAAVRAIVAKLKAAIASRPAAAGASAGR